MNEEGGFNSALEEFTQEQGQVCENCADDDAYNNCLDTLDSLTEATEDEMGCINGILGEDYFTEKKKVERMQRRKQQAMQQRKSNAKNLQRQYRQN